LEFDGSKENIPEEYRVTGEAQRIVKENIKARERPAPKAKKSITAKIEAREKEKKAAPEIPAQTKEKTKTKNEIEL
jgi:hypothetical protein